MKLSDYAKKNGIGYRTTWNHYKLGLIPNAPKNLLNNSVKKMITLKAFKYRIYPTKQQLVLLNKTFGCVRVVWNHNVECFNKFDKNKIEQEQPLTTTLLRQKFEWMNEVSAAALQQKELDFKSFKNNYFSKTRKKKVGRPQFKNKDNVQSFRLPNKKFTLLDISIRLE